MLDTFKYYKLFIFLFFVLPINLCQQNINNAFVIEYFFYRAPSTVVGFTCNTYESNIQLIRKFNDIKLSTAIWKFENNAELKILNNKIYFKIGIFIDLRCESFENVKSFFNKATDYKMFDELYYWLILGSNLNESLSLVNDDSFGLSTDFVIAIYEENQFILYDIYNPSKFKGGYVMTSRLGIWDEKNGFNIFELNKIHRWNLQGMTIKIGVFLPNKPANMTMKDYLENYSYKQFDRITRLGYIMWKHLAEMFNFTLDFFESSKWNSEDINSPIINSLINGEIDGSGTGDTITNDRINIIKAVYSSLPFRTCFIFRSKSSDQVSVRDIFLPLSSNVWYLTIGISLLSVNALAFLLLFSSNDFYETYLQSIIIHVGAFCQQSTEFSSDNLSGRIAILHILLFNLLLYNYYLASAVSNRLSEPIIPINDSLNELRKKDFQYASEPMIEFDYYIKNSDWETKSFYANKWSKIPEAQKFMSAEKGMALVYKGGFAYHTLPEIGYPYVERYFDDRKICELQEIHLVKPQQLSIFVHANSTFTEMFKNGFTRLTEVGIRDRLIQQWSVTKPSCRTDILTADSIKIKEVVPAIIFLFLSMLISIAMLTLEFIFFLYYKRSVNLGAYLRKDMNFLEKWNKIRDCNLTPRK